MRRTIFALSIVLSSIGLIGCEDGPNQTFQPTPPGAGDLINNSGVDGAVDPASQGYGMDAGNNSGSTKLDVCPGPQKASVWAAMVKKPIVPPLGGGGIDMSGKDWAGLTVEQAEDPNNGGNCQSDNVYTSGDGTSYNAWGDGQEVLFQYFVSTHKLFRMLFTGGYVGTVDFKSRDGNHTYSIGNTNSATSGRVLLDGVAQTLDWSTPDQGSTFPKMTATIEPLVDALFATFLPDLPAVPHCLDNALCQVASFTDGEGYLYVPALGFGFRVNPYYAAQPTPSTVYFVEIELTKVLPFAGAPPMLKLDQEGPIAKQAGLGKNGTTCELRMTSHVGTPLTYGDFLKNCVQVNGGAADTTALNKLLGGLQHDEESFSFDVSGVDINFTDKTLPPDQVVNDTAVPSADDEAATFDVDQNTTGVFANDFLNNDPTSPTKDLHGAGYVYFDFARNVQEYLQQFRPANTPERKLGDPACLAPNLVLKNDGSIDPTHPVPPGCTGMEGFMTTIPASAVTSVANQPFAANVALDPAIALQTALRLGLKPGHPTGYYCTKKASAFTGADHPDTDTVSCVSKLIFGGSFDRVVQVFGQGKASNLPLDAQDRRFFFKQYAIALFRYLKLANTATASLTADMVHNVTLDPNNLFFDSIGAGQFEQAEYVERSTAVSGELPTDVKITADVIDGIFNDYAFARYLYRGERALYQGIQCTDPDTTHCAPGDHPLQGLGAAENRALLTNLFGSPILKADYTDVLNTPDGGTATTHTAFECSTADPPNFKDLSGTGDLTTCNNQLPPMMPPTSVACDTNADCNAATFDGTTPAPLCQGASLTTPKAGSCTDILRDDAGRPFLAGYPGTVGARSTVFSLGASPARVTTTYSDIQAAMMNIKFHVDPYDLSSNYVDNKGSNVLVPWAPKQPGIGFPVALSGTTDQFVNTSQLDLSGTTISANIDYDLADPTAVTAPLEQQALKFLAVETSDFLGDVFVCKDGKTGDILTARMYSSVALILDWFASHTTAYNDCGMITRYSPYNNYPDYITSLTNGVRLSVTQGGGYGRIVDVILYDPASVPPLQQ